jgi:carbon storage regulator
MLVLKRKVGESITIGSDITVIVKKSNGHYVHLAVQAPRNIAVMRTELTTNKEDNTMMNTQARLEGSDTWNDYGPVALYDAAKQEAIKTALGVTLPQYEWLIEVRRENDDSTPAIMVKVKTSITAEIVDPRRGAE